MKTILFSLLSISAVMSALIIFMLVFRHTLTKKFTAQCRYRLWTLIMCCLTAVFVPLLIQNLIPESVDLPVNITLPAFENFENKFSTENVIEHEDFIEEQPIINTEPNKKTEPVTNDANNPIISDIDTNAQANTYANIFDNIKSQIAGISILNLILCLWLITALFILIKRFISYNIFMKSLNKSISREPSEREINLYNELCVVTGVAKAPRLAITKASISPMLSGFFHSKIFIPDISLSDTALGAVLLHELTHYKRKDLFYKLLSTAAVSLHWFNPLVYIAEKQLNLEMELSCDDSVLFGVDEQEKLSYSEALLQILKLSKNKNNPLTSQFNPKKSALKIRFTNIFDNHFKKHGKLIIAVTSILCITAGILIACILPSSNAADKVTIEETTDTATLAEETTDAEKAVTPNVKSDATYIVPKNITYIKNEFDFDILKIADVNYEIKLDYDTENIIDAIVLRKGVPVFSLQAVIENDLFKKLTVKTIKVENGEYVYLPERTRTLTYDDKGLLIQDTCKSDLEDLGYFYDNKYTYNSQGNIVLENFLRFNASGSTHTSYIYNEKGKLIKKDYKQKDRYIYGSSSDITNYTYDDKNNLIDETTVYSSGGIDNIVYSYNENSQITEFIKYFAKSSDMNNKETLYKESYVYDNLGRNKQSTFYYYSGEPLSVVYTYSTVFPDLIIGQSNSSAYFDETSLTTHIKNEKTQWMYADGKTSRKFNAIIKKDKDILIRSMTSYFEKIAYCLYYNSNSSYTTFMPENNTEKAIFDNLDLLVKYIGTYNAESYIPANVDLPRFCFDFILRFKKNNPDYTGLGKYSDNSEKYILTEDEITKILCIVFGDGEYPIDTESSEFTDQYLNYNIYNPETKEYTFTIPICGVGSDIGYSVDRGLSTGTSPVTMNTSGEEVNVNVRVSKHFNMGEYVPSHSLNLMFTSYKDGDFVFPRLVSAKQNEYK